MSETTEASVQSTEQKQEQVAPSPFAGNAWAEQVAEPPKETTIETPAAAVETPAAKEEEITEPKEWLKREFNVEDAAILKAEREELKKLKETTPQEIKFADDNSKQIYELLRDGKKKEVREFLETQEKLEKYTTADVDDSTAADIIKLGMQLKYKDLTASEIEYKYNKQFTIPKEPVQLIDELDEDFAQRKAGWQEQVNDVKMNKIIEAKLAKPELEKLKAQIVLPAITNQQPKPEEPTQESLDAQKKWAENFLQALESNYSKAEGFTTKVKDESVEIPVQFKIPDEDKVAIKGRLEKGLNIDKYMGERWFDDKDNPKVEQMVYDMYVLENLDKILSGVANNSAAKRLAEHLKAKSNVNVNVSAQQQTFDPSKNGNSQVSPYSKEAWSEKPVVINN